MTSDNREPVQESPRGLPPVEPPSGRFIAQLFLVPGLIVTVLVLIWLAGTYLVAERRNPDYFLRNLDSGNADVRWRAAHDLAQVLQRPEAVELASDPKFALNLAGRLEDEWQKLLAEEKAVAERVKDLPESEQAREWQKLAKARDYVLYLTASLSSFTIPVGAPVLCELATQEPGPYLKGDVLRRRRAVWALINLGQNQKRFGDLLAAKREAVVAELAALQSEEGRRGEWAKAAFDHQTGKAPLRVDAALAECAASDDIFLRSLVGLALNFWDGPEAQPTLLRLARDDGHGHRIEVGEQE